MNRCRECFLFSSSSTRAIAKSSCEIELSPFASVSMNEWNVENFKATAEFAATRFSRTVADRTYVWCLPSHLTAR